MRKCIFCGARANSVEHFWPVWALERLPRERLKGFIGTHEIDFSGDYTIGCVCASCNGGWMSAIETANMPLLGAMMTDKSMRLTPLQQEAVAKWAVLKSMVLDFSAVSKQGHLFYTQEEHDNFRTSEVLPPKTDVWLGRYLGMGREAHATGVKGRLGVASRSGLSVQVSPAHFQDLYQGHVTTILMGAVCIQVLTIHTPEKYRYGAVDVQSKPGLWDLLLLTCWPTQGYLYWPPILAFDGPALPSIRTLHERWQQGVEL